MLVHICVVQSTQRRHGHYEHLIFADVDTFDQINTFRHTAANMRTRSDSKYA